jgi:uncharacterized membrane protein (DUF2068 family)
MRMGGSHPRGLWLIAAFKFFKGLALLAVGIGTLNLMHKNVAAQIKEWVELLQVDPQNHYIHRILETLSKLDARRLKELSVGTFFYSALFLTEGIGLGLRKRWAEYLTIVSTSLFIPLEVYELVKRGTLMKGILLLVNAAIVAYLVKELRRNTRIA